MRTGILIIISLILGYLQGLKKKRRKLNKVIQKLEKENDALLQELNDIKKEND